MNQPFALITATFLFTLVGCDKVTLDGPIGERIGKAEAEAYVGRWTNEDSNVFDFRLASDGTLIVGSTTWDADQQRHVTQNHKVDVRRLGSATYAVFEEKAGNFEFVRVEWLNDQQLRFYWPDPERYREAVRGGQIDGTVTTGQDGRFHVHIQVKSELTKGLFSREEIGDLNHWKPSQDFRCVYRFGSDADAEP